MRSHFEEDLRGECIQKAVQGPLEHRFNRGNKKATKMEWDMTTPGLWIVLSGQEMMDLKHNFNFNLPRRAREGSEGSHFMNIHFKIGDSVLFWLDSVYKGRAGVTNGEAYIRRFNFSKPWILDSLTNGSLSIFNMRYDDYNLVVLSSVHLPENTMDVVVAVIHLKSINTRQMGYQAL